MNNQPYYWGIYGKTHREIYEDSLAGKIDPAARKATENNPINDKPGLLERILERIFHTDEHILEEARNYKPQHPNQESNICVP